LKSLTAKNEDLPKAIQNVEARLRNAEAKLKDAEAQQKRLEMQHTEEAKKKAMITQRGGTAVVKRGLILGFRPFYQPPRKRRKELHKTRTK
jgi:multidrug resistance efflux pump